MSEKLLSRIRKLNWTLSESTTGYVSFDDLCDLIGEMLDSNIYVLNKRGKVLAAKFNEGEEAPLFKDETGKVMLPEKYNDRFLKITETKDNLIYDSIKDFYGQDYAMASKYHVIVPIIFGGRRVATLLLARPEKAYDDEDIAICEYGATVIGIEVTRGIAAEEEADNRDKNAVNMPR